MKLVDYDGFSKTATVGELIAALRKFDPDAIVLSEGCDCIGNIVDITIETDGSVLLRRDN